MVEEQEQRLGLDSGENDLAGGGAEEGGDVAAGCFDHALQRGSEGVASAGIAPALGEKWEPGLEHFRPERRGGVVLLKMALRPVNALTAALRQALQQWRKAVSAGAGLVVLPELQIR